MRRHACIMASFALGAAACVSNSIAETPGTLAPGSARVGLGIGYVEARSETAAGGLPIELSARFGVHDRVDLGVKMTPTSIEVEPKAQIVRGSFDLSIAAAAGVTRDPDSDGLVADRETRDGMYTTRARLIAGQRLSDVLDLVMSVSTVLAFRGGRLSEPEGDWSDRAVALGGGIGLSFGARDHLMPEVTVTRVVHGRSPAGNAFDAGATLVQWTLTCLLGGREAEDQDGPDARR